MSYTIATGRAYCPVHWTYRIKEQYAEPVEVSLVTPGYTGVSQFMQAIVNTPGNISYKTSAILVIDVLFAILTLNIRSINEELDAIWL